MIGGNVPLNRSIVITLVIDVLGRFDPVLSCPISYTGYRVIIKIL